MKTDLYLVDPPSLDAPGFVIEQGFLRHQKIGSIPHLEKYLERLNEDDWTGLLANNPREEFVQYLSAEMMKKINWRYVLACIMGYKKYYL